MAANGYRVSFCGDENVLKLTVVMTVCFKCVNYMSTKLSFLNALKRKLSIQ